MGQALAVIESTLRNKPELFTCANDYVLMNMMKDRVQSGAIGVGHAISRAHTQKYGAPAQPPLPEPLPEFDYCPHCRGSYSFIKLTGNNCPHCGKQVREPNAWSAMMAAHPEDYKAMLADTDATE